MAYDREFLQLRAVGYLGGKTTGDIWMVGLKLAPAAPGSTISTTGMAAFLTTLLTPFISFHLNTDVKAGDYCFLEKLQGAVVGTDGKYVGDDQITTEVFFPAPQAGAGTSMLPNATACAYTLVSAAHARGRGARNRFMYPSLGAQIGGSAATTGLFSAANTAGRAAAGVALIRAINTAATVYTPDLFVSVMSGIGTGVTSAAQYVKVGNVPDHIERRESKLKPEAYNQLTI